MNVKDKFEVFALETKELQVGQLTDF